MNKYTDNQYKARTHVDSSRTFRQAQGGIKTNQTKPDFWMKNRLFLGLILIGLFIGLLQVEALQKPFSILKPTIETTENRVFESLLPKLYAIRNTYRVNTNTSFIPKAGASGEYEDLNAYAVVEFESGSVIAEKNLDKRLPIASLTKLMTAVVVLDLAEQHELFTVSEYASKQIPTKIGVVPGEQMSVEELVNAIMLTSANDAADVIREGVDAKYGDHVFIKAMNEKAKFIGLTNTNFDNPQGFDGDNYSSVRDYAVLSHYALTHYPLIAEVVAKDYEFLPANEHHKQFDLPNWNGLIGVYPHTTGIKIGNTELAQKTTAVVSERSGKKMLVIALGAPDIIARDMWAAQLLDLGYQTTLDLEPVDITEKQLREKYATWNY